MERAELPVPLGADPLQSLTSPALWLQVHQKGAHCLVPPATANLWPHVDTRR